jgi:DNA repair protein RadC
MKNAGEVLGIKLLDHVIVGLDSYYSYSETGKL